MCASRSRGRLQPRRGKRLARFNSSAPHGGRYWFSPRSVSTSASISVTTMERHETDWAILEVSRSTSSIGERVNFNFCRGSTTAA
jgi:hypothetical protein